MRKHRFVKIFVVAAILVNVSNFLVSAQPVNDAKEVIEYYHFLERLFIGETLNSEWLHVITDFEFHDDSNLSLVSRENWFHYNEGKVDVAFEWTSFTDEINDDQISMLKDSVWLNLTNREKWLATSNEIDFFSNFGDKLEEASSFGGEVRCVDIVIGESPILQFSYKYNEEDGSLRGTRGVFLINKLTGIPIQSEVYFLYKGGNEKLVNRIIYNIEANLTPPIDDLKTVQEAVENEESTYQWLLSDNQQMGSTKSWPWYYTKYHAENVVVSGLTITSYKRIIVRPDYWSGSLYTGVPSGLLQEVGANWYSIQELCNGTTYNRWIATTPVIYSLRNNWYKTSGDMSYIGSCDSSHELYVNGSHYAKYNYVVMSPSPLFSIWWPGP